MSGDYVERLETAYATRRAKVAGTRPDVVEVLSADLRAALDELEQLRALLPAATEFTFRPDFGALNDEFSDDPAGRDAVVLSWRGPAAEGADPDRWAITLHGIYCWSRSKGEWTYEPRPSSRDDDFLGDHRFSRDEAMGLMPGLLAEIAARRIPELQRMVEARR